MRTFPFLLGLAVIGWAGLATTGCRIKTPENGDSGSVEAGRQLEGTVRIDGSSTVFPIAQAAAEEFQKLHPHVHVVVGTSGTGGGFSQWIKGETDINNASRPIKPGEIEAARKNGIEFIELRVAIDGLSVVVNASNDFVDCLTVEQLREIWEPGSKIETWSDVNPEWPAEEIKLYGPDTDSGTFEYFTEVIMGEGGASRSDYTPSTDDNVLVQGVAGDRYSLGYFGYAYFVENQDKLKVLGVAPGSDPSGCVKPTDATIESGAYTPLSRPLYMYVNLESLARPEVAAFSQYVMTEGQSLVSEVGYIPLSASMLAEEQAELNAAIAASEAGAAGSTD